jgi:hypothetical protein
MVSAKSENSPVRQGCAGGYLLKHFAGVVDTMAEIAVHACFGNECTQTSLVPCAHWK